MPESDAQRQWISRVLGLTLQAPPQASPAPMRLEHLQSRFLEAVHADPEARSRLNATMAMAIELTDAGDERRANVVLDRLETLLKAPDKQPGRPKLPTTDKPFYDLIRGEGQLVNYRKALLAWDAAQKNARDQIDALKSEVSGRFPELARSAGMLDKVMLRLGSELADALDGAMSATDLAERSARHRAAAELGKSYLMTVNFDPVFRLIDSNPVRPLSLRGSLSAGLEQVVAAIPG